MTETTAGQAQLVLPGATMPDLAPGILRQRLVIEGVPAARIDASQVSEYLGALSSVCGMVTIAPPTTHHSDRFGWAGWIHWETSGAHFYAWDRPSLFFSVDIYTCKSFDPNAALEFTAGFFGADPIAAKEF